MRSRRHRTLASVLEQEGLEVIGKPAPVGVGARSLAPREEVRTATRMALDAVPVSLPRRHEQNGPAPWRRRAA